MPTSSPNVPPVGPTPAPVLVVQGEHDHPSLPAHAAAEARRRRTGVHLLRVLPLLPGAGPGDPALRAQGRHDDASRQLARTARLVRGATGGPPLRVSTEIAYGPTPRTVRDRTDEVGVVLVGHDRDLVPTGTGRWPLAWVVAAESAAPVVVLPTGWPAEDPADRGEVVAVVDPQDADAPLRAAAREARRRRVGFRVLRVTRRAVEARVGSTTRAVARATRGAQVAVVQRRHAVRTTERLGPLAEVVLRSAGCPVQVVDPGPRRAVVPASEAGALSTVSAG